MMLILPALLKDLPAILALQKIAYLSEAKLLNRYDIPPLTQTLADIEQEFDKGIILKAVDETQQLIGSIRGYKKNNTLYLGKLMVHPLKQNQGIGKQLLLTLETHYPNLRYELFTSAKSARNLVLYTQNGYKEFKREIINNDLTFVFFEKQTA